MSILHFCQSTIVGGACAELCNSAKSLITEYGMGKRFGFIVIKKQQHWVDFFHYIVVVFM